jgi:lipopolysaccharide transport system ATP-binding protein
MPDAIAPAVRIDDVSTSDVKAPAVRMDDVSTSAVVAPAVRIDDVSKRYYIEDANGAGSLRDRLGKVVSRRSGGPRGDAAIWALRHVSFEVPHGKVMGILGRSGSGKTTHMRIVARITSPTEGHVTVQGRVGALFQLGTGFHPELSGRENVYLSAAILGIDVNAMGSRFEQIVDFAEIGDSLDTPVKHYSSGMYLRLAFSVSAHLEAEVLLIDEVLAVGDARFQEKCRIRIREMVTAGRTVLFVSHTLQSVEELCDQAVVLENGTLVFDGSTKDAVDLYLELNKTKSAGPQWVDGKAVTAPWVSE